MNVSISTSDICLRYGDKTILDHVTIQVNAGDFFVIVGPNGAGKTSLLKVLMGNVLPTSGSFEIMGRPSTVYSRRQLARIISIVPQHVPLDFPFTVAETILMGRSPHMSLLGLEQQRDIEIAGQAMQFTDVAHLARRRLDRLSGGELQRVIIARAVCQQPRIILLDEPTASLDPLHQLKIMDLMERLRSDEGVTVIMVSHDLNLAALYGDRLLLMKDGAVRKEGDPEEVLSGSELEKVYGCKMLVDKNPVSRGPRINPVPEKYSKKTVRTV